MPYSDPIEQKAYFKRYWKEHKEQANINKTKWRKTHPRWRSKKKATCHPDRSLYSIGLCRPCYDARLNAMPQYVATNKQRKAKWFERNRERAVKKSKTYHSTKWDKQFGWPLGTHAKLKKETLVCDLCHKPFTSERKATDHDHITGKFRGIIHSTRNTGIGGLLDSEEMCLLAAAYLRKHK